MGAIRLNAKQDVLSFCFLLTRVVAVVRGHDRNVEGARRAGVHSALYAPDGPADTQAELVVRDWRDFPAQIAAF